MAVKKEDISIDLEELAKLEKLCAEANEKYEPDTQFDHYLEEMAELILAMARKWRNRSTDEDILEEIVDVFMCSVQMGPKHFGADRFNEMLAKKNKKFAKRVEEGWVKGQKNKS